MKKTLMILITAILIYGCSAPQEKEYCGIVIDKHISHSNSGYVYYNVVFKPDSTGRTISLNTSANAYYNSETGKRNCFLLTERDLER